MRFPQEVVVDVFLPAYRALLARRLAEADLSQDAIAERVGVSQAQVSKYLADEHEPDERVASDGRVQRAVDRVAEGLVDGTMDDVLALAESLALVRRLENRGPICQLHEERMPSLRGTGCDACIEPRSRVMREHAVLVDLRVAVRRLTLVEGFTGWVPHVGTNIAQAIEGAEGPWDVAALPGRINVVGGQARVMTEPSFGASRHVATVVLAVADEHPRLRSAVNVAYREPLLDAARASEMPTVSFDPSYEGRRERVRARLAEHGGRPPTVLYHEGDFGIEPVAYVLGEDGRDVVDNVQALLANVEET